jgi:hypothetical protein
MDGRRQVDLSASGLACLDQEVDESGISSSYAVIALPFFLPFPEKGKRAGFVNIGQVISFSKAADGFAECCVPFTRKIGSKKFGYRQVLIQGLHLLHQLVPIATDGALSDPFTFADPYHPALDGQVRDASFCQQLHGNRQEAMDKFGAGFYGSCEALTEQGMYPATRPGSRFQYDHRNTCRR